MNEVSNGVLAEDLVSAQHAHPKNLQHHFTDTEQQFDAAKMGMWLFLLTEVLLFGGLFCAYAVYNATHPEMFKSAHHMLDWKMGAVNTIVLISSSVTIALAIRSIQMNNTKQSAILLGITLACAFIFLVVKYFEYSHKIHVGMLPGHFFNYDGSDGPIVGENPHIFFSIYFTMTGIHGIHVLAGIGVISWILIRLLKGEFSSEYYTPVELAGLYWHLVDLIWIYLFPLLYLIG